MQVVYKMQLETANRGMKLFVISANDKSQYFAHEVGELTQWARLFNTGECNAHRINKTRRHGNAYGRRWIIKPFKTISEAVNASIKQAQETIIFC